MSSEIRQQARAAVLSALERWREPDGPDTGYGPTYSGPLALEMDRVIEGINAALDRYTALVEAEVAVEGWDKSGWPHNYIPGGGVHNNNCWACDELKARRDRLQAAEQAIREARDG